MSPDFPRIKLMNQLPWQQDIGETISVGFFKGMQTRGILHNLQPVFLLAK